MAATRWQVPGGQWQVPGGRWQVPGARFVPAPFQLGTEDAAVSITADQSESYAETDTMAVSMAASAAQTESYAETDTMAVSMAASAAQTESYAETDTMAVSLTVVAAQTESYAISDAMAAFLVAEAQQAETYQLADSMFISVSGITPVNLAFAEEYEVTDAMACDVYAPSGDVVTYRLSPSGPSTEFGGGALTRSAEHVGTVVVRNVRMDRRYWLDAYCVTGLHQILISSDGVSWFPLFPPVMYQRLVLPLPLFGADLWVECAGALLVISETL